jgi:hypothetical protein
MKTPLLFIAVIIYNCATAQMQGGFEQYYYVHNPSTISMGPIAYLQTKNNWYAEARYNYEEIRTFSFYAGKVFSHSSSDISYSLIPMVGGVVGRFNGGSFGLHASLDIKRFFVTSQSQYTFSTQDKWTNFYFNWTEAGYHVSSRFYTGLAVQHTCSFLETTKNDIVDIGLMAAYSFGEWSFPVYIFNNSENRFFVLGINWEWEKK